MMNDPQRAFPTPAAPGANGGLRVESTVDPESPVAGLFFQHYDRAFVLPHEKEGLEGFRECLALNHGESYERLRARYGPFREVVLVAREAGGEIVGGANYIAYPLPSDGSPILAVNLNYIFVVEAWRRRGYFRELLAAVERNAVQFFAPGAAALQPIIFIEQNDPLRMTEEEYRRDTGHAGLDQIQRILIWAKLGARIVDFPYVQPPLSAAQSPDATLCYAVIGTTGPAIDACLLREHLMRFFAISVLKGGDPERDPTARPQLSELAKACAERRAIPLLDLSALNHEALAAYLATPPEKRPHSLRDALRNSVTDRA